MNVVIYRKNPVELIEIGDVVLTGVEDAVAKLPVPCTVLETRNTTEGIELFVRRVGLAEGKRTVLRAKRGDGLDMEVSAAQATEVVVKLREQIDRLGYYVGLGPSTGDLAEYREMVEDTGEHYE
jgi:hypothetical protein